MIVVIKLVGRDAETHGELLNEFFRGCYKRGHRPIKVEHGWLVIEDDRAKTRRGYNMLVGTYETKGDRRWEV